MVLKVQENDYNHLLSIIRRYEKALSEIANHYVLEDESEFDFLEITALQATGYGTVKEIAKEALQEN